MVEKKNYDVANCQSQKKKVKPVKVVNYSWIARDVIALIVKLLDVKIADQRYVNACKNTDSKDYRVHLRL